MQPLKHLYAFLLGIREFRLTCTTSFDDDHEGSLSVAYDWGRELAHRVTLRHYEP